MQTLVNTPLGGYKAFGKYLNDSYSKVIDVYFFQSTKGYGIVCYTYEGIICAVLVLLVSILGTVYLVLFVT